MVQTKYEQDIYTQIVIYWPAYHIFYQLITYYHIATFRTSTNRPQPARVSSQNDALNDLPRVSFKTHQGFHRTGYSSTTLRLIKTTFMKWEAGTDYCISACQSPFPSAATATRTAAVPQRRYCLLFGPRETKHHPLSTSAADIDCGLSHCSVLNEPKRASGSAVIEMPA